MNFKNIQTLIDGIKLSKLTFDMDKASCKPVDGLGGCIGCHAATIWDDLKERTYAQMYSWHNVKLAKKLGINEDQVIDLCYPGRYKNFDYDSVIKEEAIQVLEKLRDTGRVDWSFAINKR